MSVCLAVGSDVCVSRGVSNWLGVRQFKRIFVRHAVKANLSESGRQTIVLNHCSTLS